MYCNVFACGLNLSRKDMLVDLAFKLKSERKTEHIIRVTEGAFNICLVLLTRYSQVAGPCNHNFVADCYFVRELYSANSFCVESEVCNLVSYSL